MFKYILESIICVVIYIFHHNNSIFITKKIYIEYNYNNPPIFKSPVKDGIYVTFFIFFPNDKTFFLLANHNDENFSNVFPINILINRYR